MSSPVPGSQAPSGGGAEARWPRVAGDQVTRCHWCHHQRSGHMAQCAHLSLVLTPTAPTSRPVSLYCPSRSLTGSHHSHTGSGWAPLSNVSLCCLSSRASGWGQARLSPATASACEHDWHRVAGTRHQWWVGADTAQCAAAWWCTPRISPTIHITLRHSAIRSSETIRFLSSIIAATVPLHLLDSPSIIYHLMLGNLDFKKRKTTQI